MKKVILCFFIITLVFTSCDKEKYFDGPDFFSDDFENYNFEDDLIDGENVFWSFFQLTYQDNYVSVDSVIFHSGNRSIKTYAISPDEDAIVSKASINKHKMAFWEGEIVQISAWYYIQGNDTADWLFILDIEEQASIGAGPGMRLVVVNNKLRVEHKYLNPDIMQQEGNEIDFPRNQWVNIVFELKLSQKDEGYVKLWQDGVLIINQDNWQTLPVDILYFQQGTKGMYTSIEFGNTANSTEYPMLVYVDDVEIKVIE
ncbi:MAG: heparin lyase I family protein [Bacteroidales bacterium]|nr:heparin lyase I family protein [Bacteroidales bacterium]